MPSGTGSISTAVRASFVSSTPFANYPSLSVSKAIRLVNATTSFPTGSPVSSAPLGSIGTFSFFSWATVNFNLYL
jgi:hypothetical protein